MLKLYDYYRSSASFRVRIALNLKGLDYHCEEVHLVNNGGEQHSPSYTKLNPQALVPSLQVGATTITQSLAIIDYLEEQHPNPSVYTNDAISNAHIRSLAQIIACDTHPVNNLRVLSYLKNELKISDAQKQQWYQHWVELGLRAFQDKLQQHESNKLFCFGDQITLADICLAPQMYNARRFNCDLSKLDKLVAIDANCQQHPAFKAAWPEEISA